MMSISSYKIGRHSVSALIIGLWLLPTPGLALSNDGTSQDTPLTTISENTRVFEPSFFDIYAPNTALEMIRRIPGFQVNRPQNKRGLGQGGTNVLINGHRLTGKSDNPLEQVGRIAAKNVIRIEIVDGTSLNIPGLTGQVANIISKSTGMTGTWEWRPEWRTDLKANILRGNITLSGEKGDIAYTAKLKNESFRNGHWGPEYRRFADQTLFEIRDEKAQYFGDTTGGSVNLTWTPRQDHIGNANFEYNQFNFNNNTVSHLRAITKDGTNGLQLFSRAEDEWNGKIDGDYQFPFMRGNLKLIGYYRAEHSPTISRFEAYDYDSIGHESSTRYYQTADEGEAIARTEYSWSPRTGYDWQIGAEGAFNFLDIEGQFIDLLDMDNSEDPTQSRVEEKRAELTLTHSRPLSSKWDAQASLGIEYSELSQGALVREFVRPKGFISATYKPETDVSIRAKIEREVGQLNFFDFISSVSLSDDLNTQGNPNLVPSQSWVGELEFDKQFAAGHSFKARFYGQQISDLVDRIPIGVDGDAVGNIDSAQQYGVEFNTTLKGDPWGLKGTELNLELELRDSSVEDPVQHFKRNLNNERQYNWQIFFRHDIPDTSWAWGLFADGMKRRPVYRLSTIDQLAFEPALAFIFVEHKDIWGIKVNARLMNLLDASDDFRRIMYTDRRDIGEIDFIEERSREFDLMFRLTMSGAF